MTRRVFFLATVALPLAALATACGILLGGPDLPVLADAGGDAMAGRDTGQKDAPTADASMPLDGPQDADAAPPLQLLTCTLAGGNQIVSTIPPPDGSGGGGNGNGPFNPLFVEHVSGMNIARVLAGVSNPGGSTVVVYTVPEPNMGGTTIQSVSLPNAGLRGELKTSGGVTLLVQDYMTNSYALYSIADTNPGNDYDASTWSPIATIGALPDEGGMTNGQFNMEFVEIGTNSYYTLAAYAVPEDGGAGIQAYELSSWVSSQSTWQTLLGPGPGLNIGALLPDSPLVYGFFAPPGMTGGGPLPLLQYTFNTASPSAPAQRNMDASAATLAVAADAGAFSLAFAEIVGSQSADLRVGNVSAADITKFKVDGLPRLTFNVQSDGGLFDTTPFGGNSGGPDGRWLSNGYFGILGSGGTGGGTFTGLNFYVATPEGQWLIEMAGTGKNVLKGQTIVTRAFDLASSTANLVEQFDLVWVEMQTDGSYVLYFNELSCTLP